MVKWEITNLQTIRSIKPSIKSSILSYEVGLDPVTTSYLVDWIERTHKMVATSLLTT